MINRGTFQGAMSCYYKYLYVFQTTSYIPCCACFVYFNLVSILLLFCDAQYQNYFHRNVFQIPRVYDYKRPLLHPNLPIIDLQTRPFMIRHGFLPYTLPINRRFYSYYPTTDFYVWPLITLPNSPAPVPSSSSYLNMPKETQVANVTHEEVQSSMFSFLRSLETFERRFYKTNFIKLSSMTSKERQENGISFIQSGLFLCVALLAISSEVDASIRQEIEQTIGFRVHDKDLAHLLNEINLFLPTSSNTFKFRRATRLVLRGQVRLSDRFCNMTAPANQLRVDRIVNNEVDMTRTLNEMVLMDSGGAMQNTFDEDELSNGICGVLITTMYVRPRWRSAPTVMNSSYPFYDGSDTRSTRMMRINDIMLYADLRDWNAEAIEIQYDTPNLSLLLLIPRNSSLRQLAGHMWSTTPSLITEIMSPMRVAATIPVYTLRMTLLLPNKLEEMGIIKLFTDGHDVTSGCQTLLLSHAVQRLMFWSEPGRNSYKDDGIEWDGTPEKEIVVDRPYLFYLRWKNVTLINGNFVL